MITKFSGMGRFTKGELVGSFSRKKVILLKTGIEAIR